MPQVNWLIRPFTPEDYPGITEAYNAAHPDQTTTAQELRERDEKRQAFLHFQRLVAEMAGRIVASGYYTQNADSYHPQKFWFDESVHPEYRGRGIGSAIYDRLLQALTQFDPLSLRADVPEDMAAGIQFLQKRGFQADGRSWESHLALTAFDLAPYAGREESFAKSHGYKSLKTWNDTYNPSILALNERLGFVRQRAIIHFVKRFRTE